MRPIDRLKAQLTSIADSIRDRTGSTEPMTLAEMKEEIEYMPSGADDNAYILVDEFGNEVPAVLTEEEVDLTATANDIREGVVAVTDDGVITGEKEIPSYHTSEGFKLVRSGSDFSVAFPNYDYTKLQAIICVFNTSMSDSVAARKVVINDNVYPVDSTVADSEITKNDETKTVDFGITNDLGADCLIRYFSYKEIY